MNPENVNSTPITNPTSESPEVSLDFELVSKKEKKFPILLALVSVIILGLITFGVLFYLQIIKF